ncbi:diaminopimelate epimerase [Thermodesulfobacteriota bacterium]
MNFPITFTKMSGSGNDFIIIDHRTPFLDPDSLPAFTRAICTRKFSVGADGLILIEPSTEADFSWTFLNADGSSAEMCGNGARCAARYAYANSIAPASMRFMTTAGIIEAEVIHEAVKLKMTTPESLVLDQKISIAGQTIPVHSINTGVPHAVHFVEEAQSVPVKEWGHAIRFHDLFQPAGANANFVEVIDRTALHVRTYERGVEDETLACGTGAVASAIIAALKHDVTPPVTVTTSGGEHLVIHFLLENLTEPAIKGVHLEGPAHFIYEGQLDAEAIRTMQQETSKS